MTSVVAMIALVICFIDLIAASRGESFSRCIRLSQFSTTTIASSTSEPMTSTSPNMERTLMVTPMAG